MDLFALNVVDLKEFKTIYRTWFFTALLMTIGGYLLVYKKFYFITNGSLAQAMSWIFLFGVVGGNIFLVQYHKKRLAAIEALTQFDEKVTAYKVLYRQRMLFNFSVVALAVLQYSLVPRSSYLYLSFFYMFFLFIQYPTKTLFQKELKTADIHFVD